MKLTNFINGNWQDSESADYTPVLNPANGEQLSEVRLSTEEDVNLAVVAAVKAQKKWALVPAPKRADYLYEIGRIMKEKKEHLAQVLTKEMVKVV